MATTATKHANLWAALAAARAAFEPVIKDKTAKTEKFSYRYVDLASVLDAVMPTLCANGIAVYQAPTIMGDGLVLVSKLVHTDTQQEVSDMLPLPSTSNMQQLGSAISYARRYLLMAQLGIAAGDDDDAHAANGAQRPQPARAAQRTAPAQNGSQRPAQPATEPVEHASEDAPPLHQWVYDRLDGKCAKFADWSRTKHANSSGPATPAMYQYLAGVLDGITGNTTHRDVLAVLVGRPVNQDNPPGYDLVSQLLDWLPETVGKGEAKEPNPKHEPKYVPCIRAIGELVLQAQGQTSLFG